VFLSLQKNTKTKIIKMYWAIPNWRFYARNIGLVTFSSYMLHLCLPKQSHFERYVAERKIYEPEFAMRMDHPQCVVKYEDKFLFAKVTVESCNFRVLNETPFGSNLGKTTWAYYGILNNFWYEREIVGLYKYK
jgi:hypothetical protein